MLYELHAPLIMLSRSQFQQGVLTGQALYSRMQEAEQALAEAVTILALEEPDSAEGQLALHGRTALQQLRETLQELPKQLELVEQQETPTHVIADWCILADWKRTSFLCNNLNAGLCVLWYEIC